ncbi:CSC1-like protein RXW8 [Salvia hispanica]|uniref:CSC1-like protein RXW8 n=1 Tax=Salvia hispanica TaxID=49212 RepID=UPI00200976F6|nr:CSC1-like protein RXW8 [Salvia hispanica]
MNVGGLLASVGVNSVVCLGVFSLYSVLRKQPHFVTVYFGHKLARARSKRHDPFWLARLVPSASWVVKAYGATEDELYVAGGVDAVVFLRAVVFSIKLFTVASVICLVFVLPLNYFGKEMEHKEIREELLTVFTIGNVQRGSEWLGFHCFVLHIITICACFFLYSEFKHIMKMRLNHINSPLHCASQFTVVVRAIPWIDQESYSDTLTRFFTDLYSTSYLSHQMVYEKSAIQKLMSDAERMYKILKSVHMERRYVKRLLRCGFCGGNNNASQEMKELSDESKSITKDETFLDDSDECGAALVFFRTRYAALVASEALQTQNPMAWVTNAAPEPRDMFWANLCVSYQSLWIRKIIVVFASFFFVTFFLVPVVFTQSLVHLDKLTRFLPFLEKAVGRVVLEQLVTGYLPSVILTLFLYMVPPVMYVFSTLEGVISRSERKRSACIKVVYFVIWNVFFANILTEAAIVHYQISILKLGDYKNIPALLAKAVPSTATFFMTYCLTSGWASLACELIQVVPLLTNVISRYILKTNGDTSTPTPFSFPYHTEVPRVLLFGLLGITCCTLAPLILPFVLVYFVLAFLVYRNQILNVYVMKYDSGGQYWPIVHNTAIFSLVLMQVIALGVFGIKDAPGPSTFTFPLIVLTLLFNQFCRQRFLPVFFRTPAKSVIEMDRVDEQSGQMEDIHQSLLTAYSQYKSKSGRWGSRKLGMMSRSNSAHDTAEMGGISHA